MASKLMFGGSSQFHQVLPKMKEDCFLADDFHAINSEKRVRAHKSQRPEDE
ncbi:MAG: hypothetical protein ACOCX1_00210 [Fimbriimonadaceae bacterium]